MTSMRRRSAVKPEAEVSIARNMPIRLFLLS
jgi:hypothetical protein